MRHYPSQSDLNGADKLERVFRDVYDRLYAAKPVSSATPAPSPSVSNPVTLQQSASLMAAGADPVPTPPTPAVSYGLYAARPAAATVANGRLHYATDQNTLYITEGGVWVWVAGLMFGTITPDQRPTLIAGDAGFRFFGTDTFQEYYWDGAAWQYVTPDASTTVRGVVTTGAQSFAGDKTFTSSVAVTGAFGCNAQAVQTAYASGGALAGYVTGAFGLDSDAHMQALFDLVVKIRAALVANGILS
jgi:hypothetical protein